MFAGLISRWTMFFECAARSPNLAGSTHVEGICESCNHRVLHVNFEMENIRDLEIRAIDQDQIATDNDCARNSEAAAGASFRIPEGRAASLSGGPEAEFHEPLVAAPIRALIETAPLLQGNSTSAHLYRRIFWTKANSKTPKLQGDVACTSVTGCDGRLAVVCPIVTLNELPPAART